MPVNCIIILLCKLQINQEHIQLAFTQVFHNDLHGDVNSIVYFDYHVGFRLVLSNVILLIWSV
jgi:hypothetical protein